MIAPKVRADSWAALLTPEQQWALFNHHYEVVHGKWDLTCAWAEKEFELSRRPTRAAFYSWLEQMNELEEIHNEEIRTLADERAKSAASKLTVGSETMRQALTAKMMDLILVAKDPEAADKVMKIVTSMVMGSVAEKNVELKAKEVELKQSAEKRKDEELALAREKFEAAEKRLNAVKDAVKTAKTGGGLTEETLKTIEEAAGLL